MSKQLRFSTSLLFAVLCLLLASNPVWASTYDNGLPNGEVDAWMINYNFAVSNTFTGLSSVNSFTFWAWELPGDTLQSVDWSISTTPNGAPVPGGSGTGVLGVNMTDQFEHVNGFGYDIDKITVSGLTVSGLSSGATYWLNLQNAVASMPGDGVYWDENSGLSQAYDSQVGTIPSEAFNISGSDSSGTTPEPGSLLLFGSGTLSVMGLLRQRLVR